MQPSVCRRAVAAQTPLWVNESFKEVVCHLNREPVPSGARARPWEPDEVERVWGAWTTTRQLLEAGEKWPKPRTAKDQLEAGRRLRRAVAPVVALVDELLGRSVANSNPERSFSLVGPRSVALGPRADWYDPDSDVPPPPPPMVWVAQSMGGASSRKPAVVARLSSGGTIAYAVPLQHEAAWTVAMLLDYAVRSGAKRRVFLRLRRCGTCRQFFDDAELQRSGSRTAYCSPVCRTPARRAAVRQNVRASRERRRVK